MPTRRKSRGTARKTDQRTTNPDPRMYVQSRDLRQHRVLIAEQIIKWAVAHIVYLLNDWYYFYLNLSYLARAKGNALYRMDQTDQTLLPITYEMGGWLMTMVFQQYYALLPCAPDKLTGLWFSNPENINKLVKAVTAKMPNIWNTQVAVYQLASGANITWTDTLERTDCLMGVALGTEQSTKQWIQQLLPVALEANASPTVVDPIMADTHYLFCNVV